MEAQEAIKRLEAIDEAEQARRERRALLAKNASKSLEQVKEERERKAQELLAQFTEMLAPQQNDAAMEYEDILARIESEHDEELKKEVVSIDKEKQAELDKTKTELEVALNVKKSELVEQQERRLEEVKEEFEKVISSTEKMLANSQDALVDAELKRVDGLAKQEAELDRQRQVEVAKVQWELNEQAAREAAKLRNEKQVALAKADQEHQGDLAAQRSALEKEKARALSDKEQTFTDKLDQQKQLLAEVSEELAPYVQALEAKKKIIKELDANFKDFDTSAVQIDPKTGKVKLHFQESYFALGSHKLSAEMKRFLRIMIPKYARSIYGNKDAAEHVESLKISGIASPIYQGVYIDINDKSPQSEKARKYNMALSNNRAKALYDFIFDEGEMGDYEFRSRLEADMSIAALGFQNATPVQDKLVGKPAKCIEYDCKQEQATVLEFRLFTEE